MPDVYRTMLAKDAIAAKLAYCVLNNLNGERILLMQAKNLEAKFDKNKVEVPILGRTSVGHRATNWNGTGSMTIYSNTSRFTELMRPYQETGQDFYFDIIIRNYDPTSAAGGQTIILKDCNLDGVTIAAFNADGDWLEQDIDFTFERFEIPEKFVDLDGMLTA